MRWLDQLRQGRRRRRNLERRPGRRRSRRATASAAPRAPWPPADARTLHDAAQGGHGHRRAEQRRARARPSGESGVGIYSIDQPFPHEARLAGVPTRQARRHGAPRRAATSTRCSTTSTRRASASSSRAARTSSTSAGTVEHRALSAGLDGQGGPPPAAAHGRRRTSTGTTRRTPARPSRSRRARVALPFLQYERTGVPRRQAGDGDGRPQEAPVRRSPKLDEGARRHARCRRRPSPFPAGQAPKGGEQIPLAEAQRAWSARARRARAAGAAHARHGAPREAARAAGQARRRASRLHRDRLERDGKKLRLELRRGKRVIGRKHGQGRKGVAHAHVPPARPRPFRVSRARRRKSKRILARSSVFRGW